MCGIVGAVAQRNVVPILLEGLQRLEYRGYDSAGLVVINDGQLRRLRSTGRVKDLAEKSAATQGLIGIAHTRWATHGVPSERNAHPHVSVDLEERLSDEIVGLIAEGVGDIGIVAGTVDARRLTTYPFRSDRFVLVIARDHPLARRSKIGFEEVLDHDFVGLDRASALQRFLADKASRVGRPLKLRVQLRSFDAVCRLVECNVGVGIVPASTVRRAAASMAIKAVDLTDAWAIRELTICVRNFDDLPPYAQQLVVHMRASAG